MAVDHGVNPARIFCDGFAAPDGNGAVLAEMSQKDDEIGAFFARGVHLRLHGIIKKFPRFIFFETVNIFARIVFEMGGIGGNKCLRCGDADKGDCFSVRFHDFIRFENELARACIGEIAAVIAAFQIFGQFEEIAHAVIEFMIAGDGEIVIGDIHKLDEIDAV